MVEQNHRLPQDPNLSVKSRRCYQRVMSGIERGGRFRFVTLTSTKGGNDDVHRHFRALVMRLRRRGLIQGYIQVKEYTKSGLLHMHVIFRGSYIDQAYLSQVWEELHGAKIVYIQRIRPIKSKSNLANEMAKYMSKEFAHRYSWDWKWVWRGFCHDWKELKKAAWDILVDGQAMSMRQIIFYWRWCLRRGRFVHPDDITLQDFGLA